MVGGGYHELGRGKGTGVGLFSPQFHHRAHYEGGVGSFFRIEGKVRYWGEKERSASESDRYGIR
jgi:hypothetical protein